MKTLLSAILILFCIFTVFGQTSVRLVLGNPSNAMNDLTDSDNYMVAHNGFILSYNKSRGAPNWVTWHLSNSDVGAVDRSNAFAPDTTLPDTSWWIRPTDYAGSGYDRGHMCPSKDRSDTDTNNRETFLMSNMQPQTKKLNERTWKYLEDFERDLAKTNELYIYAGCYGDAGKIKNKVTIPTNCWKIIVVLKEGDNDLKRINKNTRVISVDMPNTETISTRWRTYLTTVDQIERVTGYDFLSPLPDAIESVIESRKDTGN